MAGDGTKDRWKRQSAIRFTRRCPTRTSRALRRFARRCVVDRCAVGFHRCRTVRAAIAGRPEHRAAWRSGSQNVDLIDRSPTTVIRFWKRIFLSLRLPLHSGAPSPSLADLEPCRTRRTLRNSSSDNENAFSLSLATAVHNRLKSLTMDQTE